jgi:hypothetical protein
MAKKTPVLDRELPYGDIMHGETGDMDVGQMSRYVQDGHYFRADGTYHSEDGVVRPRVVPPVQVVVDTLPSVDHDEMDALLADPRAEVLLNLTRDHLIELVTLGNGPVIQGENSTKMMVAWLVKYDQSRPVVEQPIAIKHDEL